MGYCKQTVKVPKSRQSWACRGRNRPQDLAAIGHYPAEECDSFQSKLAKNAFAMSFGTPCQTNLEAIIP